jgi:RNA polymerase sigma factor (TIGR02999 family)
MPPNDGDVTALLQQWGAGSSEAENELFQLVFPRLRHIARHLMKGERPGHSLQSVDLVDEIYLRLVAAKNRDWRNREHFFAFTARAMRRYLIDYARKRGKHEIVHLAELDEILPADSPKTELAILVDRLLDTLAETHPDWCRIVELKYFLGLTDEEAADVLGLKLRTLQRMWMDVRKWLFEKGGSSYAAGS